MLSQRGMVVWKSGASFSIDLVVSGCGPWTVTSSHSHLALLYLRSSFSACSSSGSSECHLLRFLVHSALLIPSHFVPINIYSTCARNVLCIALEKSLYPVAMWRTLLPPGGGCSWVDFYYNTGTVNCWPARMLCSSEYFPLSVLTTPDYLAVHEAGYTSAVGPSWLY